MVRRGSCCTRPRGILTFSLRSRENALTSWINRFPLTRKFTICLSRSCCEVNGSQLICDDQEDFPPRRTGAKQCVELVACRDDRIFLLIAFCLLPIAYCLLFTSPIGTITIADCFPAGVFLSFAVTDAVHGIASVGRGHFVSRIAFGSCTRYSPGRGRRDVVRYGSGFGKV